MKLIVGLGNIGKKYENTRHNFGFLVLDRLAHQRKFKFKDSTKFQGAWASESDPAHKKIFYLKPSTYMNLSGSAVQALAYFYKIEAKDVFVVYDDLDLALGSVRLARGGGAGGHKGIQSIMNALGIREIPRLKLGIGKPKHEGQETADHVLQSFNSEEMREVSKLIDHAIQAIEAYLKDDLDVAMNRFNLTVKSPKNSSDES